jgi:hypothetical protein
MPPRRSHGGLFIWAIRGLVNIVRIVPNCLGSHTEYIFTGSLQSFTVYEYFIHSLLAADACLALWCLHPAASGADGTFNISKALGAVYAPAASGAVVNQDLHRQLDLRPPVAKHYEK